MVAAANVVEVAALVGDTARATMLAALMGGEALTATELAYLARISRSTASGHLARLTAAKLVTVTRKRRFAYYRIASPLVARMMESIKAVAAIEVPPRHRPRSAEEEAQLFARSCYDHLAGYVGVAVADALAARDHVVLNDEGGEVTAAGERFFRAFGADLTVPAGSRRLFCQPCLDWSERRYHIKGRVGAAILCRCLELGWFKRVRDSRALKITPEGRDGLADVFGVKLGDAVWPVKSKDAA
ncbi:MAG: helix-turn-helix domain-containing protein [Xanthobacteraceae bacterium]|nr:helix-turn-helix domain-containing protein [Xanthobacteraceae bacterium]